MADKIWMKRVLIPLWVIQFIILFILVGLSAVVLYAVNEYDDENGRLYDNVEGAVK